MWTLSGCLSRSLLGVVLWLQVPTGWWSLVPVETSQCQSSPPLLLSVVLTESCQGLWSDHWTGGRTCSAEMYLKNTKLVLPWMFGKMFTVLYQVSARLTDCLDNKTSGQYTYHWTPDPAISTVISVLMIVTTLLPAFCSLCYHFCYAKRQQIILVMTLFFCNLNDVIIEITPGWSNLSCDKARVRSQC